MKENQQQSISETTVTENGANQENGAEKEIFSDPPKSEKADSAAPVTEGPSEGGKEKNGEFLSVVYNHKPKGLNRDEAVKYAQIGLKFENSGIKLEKIKPLFHKLDFLAAQQDEEVEGFIERLYSSAESDYEARLREKYGDDEQLLGDLMQLWREKSRGKYEKVIADRAAAEEKSAAQKQERLEQRLAGEYAALKAEIPNAPEFSALPDEVKRAAAAGQELIGAYLLYDYRRRAQLKKAEEKQTETANGSAGALRTAQNAVGSAEDDAFMRGIFGR